MHEILHPRNINWFSYHTTTHQDILFPREPTKLTRTFAASKDEGPLFDNSLSATSAAACSACRKVEQNVGLSNISPLKFTVALNRGA
jgi:hypothetical protein